MGTPALSPTAKRFGVVGAAIGVLAAGAAVGVAVERQLVNRALRRGRRDAFLLGAARGDVRTVAADDGVGLYVDVEDLTDDGASTAKAAGVTMVFCHGYALNSDSWHFQRRALGRVAGIDAMVFYDQRGHGRSPAGSKEHATIDQLGHDLARVIEETVPEGPVVLVGHSMGGMSVMALAADHPDWFGDRIRGVALLSTSPGRMAEITLGAPAAVSRLVHRLAPPVVASLGFAPRLADRGRRLSSALEVVLTGRYSFASDVPDELVDWTAAMIASTPMDVIAQFFPAFDAHDKLAALPVLSVVEVLLLCGDSDLITPPDHTREMAQALPNAELVVVPDAGHMVIAEHADVVNAALGRLVGRVAGRPE